MKILVTGHKGFIGSHVYDYLRNETTLGFSVEGMDDRFNNVLRFDKVKGFSRIIT